MYCQNCGKQLPDDANFCLYCGAKISLNADSRTPTNTATTVDPNSEKIVSELAITRLKGEISALLYDLAGIYGNILYCFSKAVVIRNAFEIPLSYKNYSKKERLDTWDWYNKTTDENIMVFDEILQALHQLTPEVRKRVENYRPGPKLLGFPTMTYVEQEYQTFHTKTVEFEAKLASVKSKVEELKHHQRNVSGS